MAVTLKREKQSVNYFPKVSVIVLNWNGRKYTRDCLISLLETNYPKIEIIVVDNASIDGTQEMVKNEYPQVILVETKENLGFCKGNNLGIRKATGDLIILLNNDTIVDKNWILKILEVAKKPEVGIIGCTLLFPLGRVIQSLGCKEKFLGHWEHVGAGVLLGDHSDPCENNVDYVSGAAFAIKRTVIDKIGLLDPCFYAYAEEADWCYRAKRAGYKIVTSNAIVYHYGSATFNRLPLKQFYLNYRNKLLLISKNYPKKALLKYFLEYPFRLTVKSLNAFSRKETSTQRISINADRNGLLRILFKTYLFNVFFFYLTLVPGLRLSSKAFHRKNWNC